MFKILIVDDEEIVRRGIKISMEWENYGFSIVGEACNGIEAMDKIRNLAPDIIITDIRMPKMDGLKLIATIKQEFPNIKVIILSGYEDFKYAQTAVRNGAFDYLIKPVEVEDILKVVKQAANELEKELSRMKTEQELRDMLRESMPVLRDKYLLRILKGDVNTNEIVHKFHFLDIALSMYDYVVICIEIDDFELVTGEMSLEDRQLTSFSIKNIIEELILDYNHSVAVELNESNITVISNYHADRRYAYEIDVLTKICEKIRYYINKYIKISVSIGIGGFYKLFSEIPKSFKEAKMALEYKLILGKGKIINIRDFEPGDNPGKKIAYPFEKESKVVSSLRIGDKENTLNAVEEFFIAILQDQNAINPSDIKKQCLSFLYTISHVLLELDIPIEKLTNTSIIFEQHINKCETIDELKREVMKSVKDAVESISETKNNRNAGFVKKAMDYINSNYCKSIMVQDVADNIYLTPNYLSSIFKQVSGYTVLEYIINTKMQHAIKILKDPNIKIGEVSEALGYSDGKYFSQLFKKHIGCTPSEYRHNVLK